MPYGLTLDDAHTRKTGREYGDGLYTHEYLARVSGTALSRDSDQSSEAYLRP